MKMISKKPEKPKPWPLKGSGVTWDSAYGLVYADYGHPLIDHTWPASEIPTFRSIPEFDSEKLISAEDWDRAYMAYKRRKEREEALRSNDVTDILRQRVHGLQGGRRIGKSFHLEQMKSWNEQMFNRLKEMGGNYGG